MRFLLSDGPFSSFACQPLSVGIHESPAAVKEPSDDFHQACVQKFNSSSLCVLEFYFVNFPISSLAPSPILCDLKHSNKLHIRKESMHHFNWIEFTMKLWQEDTQMSLCSDGLLKE
jgi:hypothetical protein